MASGIRSISRSRHHYGTENLTDTVVSVIKFDSGREAVVTQYNRPNGTKSYSVVGGSFSTKWQSLHKF